MNGAKDYETKVVQVVNNIKEVKSAEEQQKPELVKQKTEQAKKAANDAINTEKTLAKATETLAAATPSPTRPPEQPATATSASEIREKLRPCNRRRKV